MTRSSYNLLLLPGFTFDEIKGCIDPKRVGTSFEMDDYEIRHRLNEFKETLIKEFLLPDIQEINWERCRDKFINSVRDFARADALNIGANDTDNRTRYNSHQYDPKDGLDELENVPVCSAFLLVYADAGDGKILKYQSL